MVTLALDSTAARASRSTLFHEAFREGSPGVGLPCLDSTCSSSPPPSSVSAAFPELLLVSSVALTVLLRSPFLSSLEAAGTPALHQALGPLLGRYWCTRKCPRGVGWRDGERRHTTVIE